MSEKPPWAAKQPVRPVSDYVENGPQVSDALIRASESELIDLEAIRANVAAVRRELEKQPGYFSDRGDAPPQTPTERLVYDALALLAEVERLRELVGALNPCPNCGTFNLVRRFLK